MKIICVTNSEFYLLRSFVLNRLLNLDKFISNNDYSECLTKGYFEERENVLKILDKLKES